MRVNIVVNQVFDGWEPTDERLGGTELQVVKWAEGLAARGHEITVFHNQRDKRVHYTGTANLKYCDRSLYRDGADVCLSVKSPDIKPEEPTIYFTNETNATDIDLSMYGAVVWPSQWCVDNIPVNNPNVHVVPHGYDPHRIYPETKVPKLCLYASSPDRGLDTLLEAWPKVYAQHPDAQLYVTYGAQAKDIAGVTFMGEVDNETMDDLYRMADVWCHPCNGGELFCITGLNAQAAGCVPVIIPEMALRETVRHGFFSTKEDYAEVLTNVLGDENLKADVRNKLAAEDYPTWDYSTDMLEQLLTRYGKA